MKKIFLLVIIAFFVSGAFAQTATPTGQAPTPKIEQYCQVIASPRLLSNKVTIDIDFGEVKSFWRGNRLKDYDGKVRKFNTVIDALNYMGKEGWTFINAYPVTIGTAVYYHFAFKKEFLLTEVQ